MNETAEQPIEQNDMISFGFNTVAVYDVNDKNAFIYVLSKEQIETIDLDDSDDDGPAIADKIIDIDDKVIDIDSDSDSNYSGDECIQNIEEFKAECSNDEDDDSMDPDDDFDDSDSIQSDHTDEFIVTKTYLKCDTPTETIALDDEDDVAIQATPETEATVEAEVKTKSKMGTEQNGIVTPDEDAPMMASPLKAASSNEDDEDDKTDESESQPNFENDKNAARDQRLIDKESGHTKEQQIKPNDKNSVENDKCTAGPSKIQDEAERIENIRRRLDEKKKRTVALIKPMPIRKRRQTVTEEEYMQHKRSKKEEKERIMKSRKVKLMEITERQQAARDATTEAQRTQFVPKVKNVIVSRGELFLTDLMALDPSNA